MSRGATCTWLQYISKNGSNMYAYAISDYALIFAFGALTLSLPS